MTDRTYDLHIAHKSGLISMVFATRSERSEYMDAWGFENVATGVYMDHNQRVVAACDLSRLGAYLFTRAHEAATADYQRVNA